MDFDAKLKRAIERGEKTRLADGAEKNQQQMTEADLRNLHSQCRLELSDHIAACLKKVADHFPGFSYRSLMNDEGWGAVITRDDVALKSGGRGENQYSRLEMVIRPFSNAHIVDMAAKGTIRNKEAFARSHYQKLSEVDLEGFQEMIDLWILEYVEGFTAAGG